MKILKPWKFLFLMSGLMIPMFIFSQMPAHEELQKVFTKPSSGYPYIDTRSKQLDVGLKTLEKKFPNDPVVFFCNAIIHFMSEKYKLSKIEDELLKAKELDPSGSIITDWLNGVELGHRDGDLFYEWLMQLKEHMSVESVNEYLHTDGESKGYFPVLAKIWDGPPLNARYFIPRFDSTFNVWNSQPDFQDIGSTFDCLSLNDTLTRKYCREEFNFMTHLIENDPYSIQELDLAYWFAIVRYDPSLFADAMIPCAIKNGYLKEGPETTALIEDLKICSPLAYLRTAPFYMYSPDLSCEKLPQPGGVANANGIALPDFGVEAEIPGFVCTGNENGLKGFFLILQNAEFRKSFLNPDLRWFVVKSTERNTEFVGQCHLKDPKYRITIYVGLLEEGKVDPQFQKAWGESYQGK